MTPQEFAAVTAHVEYHHRGAFFSELYLFVSLCVERSVTRIIESGVYRGVSTRVFRSIWPGRVTSIEARADHVPADVPGVLIGDGCVLVPQQVSARRRERLGVFIDGPKGPHGASLRAWCLTQPQVRVVAQHDSPIGSGELIHSYDETFRRDIGDAVDRRIDPALRAQYSHGCPGMGVWVTA